MTERADQFADRDLLAGVDSTEQTSAEQDAPGAEEPPQGTPEGAELAPPATPSA